MAIILPITVDNTMLLSSNVSEDDYPAYDPGATYSKGERVIRTGTIHRIYQSVIDNNTGNQPFGDGGTHWIEVGATNRWKAFDETLSDQVQNAETIFYSFRLPSLVSAIAIFNVEADNVRIQVFNENDEQIDDRTVVTVTSTKVTSFYTYHFTGFDVSSERLILDQPGVQDLPGYEGHRIDMTFTRSGGTAKVGQIVLGELFYFGLIVAGTTVGARDFSVKRQDDFGRQRLIQRDFSRTVDFRFRFPTLDSQRIAKLLNDNRATPIVWLAGADTSGLGTTVYGWWDDYNLDLAPEISSGTVSVIGLV